MDRSVGLDNILLAALASFGSERGFRIALVEIPFSRELDWLRRWKASRREGFHHPSPILFARGSAPSVVARFRVTKRLLNNHSYYSTARKINYNICLNIHYCIIIYIYVRVFIPLIFCSCNYYRLRIFM